MSNGKWQMEKPRRFAILHLRFAIQDALFSSLLTGSDGRPLCEDGHLEQPTYP